MDKQYIEIAGKSDSEVLRMLYANMAVFGERLDAHMKFHANVWKAAAWSVATGLTIVAVVLANT